MPDCEFLAGCPFFNEKMPVEIGLGALLKKRYCSSDFSKCARYMVVQALGKGTAPIDLYPNQQDRVEQIIAKGKPS